MKSKEKNNLCFFFFSKLHASIEFLPQKRAANNSIHYFHAHVGEIHFDIICRLLNQN